MRKRYASLISPSLLRFLPVDSLRRISFLIVLVFLLSPPRPSFSFLYRSLLPYNFPCLPLFLSPCAARSRTRSLRSLHGTTARIGAEQRGAARRGVESTCRRCIGVRECANSSVRVCTWLAVSDVTERLHCSRLSHTLDREAPPSYERERRFSFVHKTVISLRGENLEW